MESPGSHRSLSEMRSYEAEEISLGDEEAMDADGCVGENCQLLGQYFTPNPHAGLPVYMTIHR